MKNIPLIIPNFNQITYLQNLINWWRWYNPENEIIIIDNGSTSEDLKMFYSQLRDIKVIFFPENNCALNLKTFLETAGHEYYVISDPDIMPHPATPPNFLELMKYAVDNLGYHHAGFGLIINDIPAWIENKANIQYNESQLLTVPVNFEYNGISYSGFRAPIDTTFSLYKKSNGGWHAPMSGEAWSNSLRIFEAFHLGWYIHPEYVNPEMDNYFTTAKYKDYTAISAGKNNNRPNKYI